MSVRKSDADGAEGGSLEADEATTEVGEASEAEATERPEPFRAPSFVDAVKQVFGRPAGTSTTTSAGSSGSGGKTSAAGSGPVARGLFGLGNRRPPARPASGTEEERLAVTYIDKRERTIGFFFGAVQVVFGVLDYLEDRRYLDKKSASQTLAIHHAAPWILAIGLVFGAFTIIATLSRRRAALGFVIILGGLALLQSGGGIFGILYLGVGIWMVFRALRRNPKAAADRTSRARNGTGNGARGRTPAASAASSSSSSKDAPSRRAPVPKTSPSKRYTPPKPHRPVPKPEKEPEPSNRVLSWLRR